MTYQRIDTDVVIIGAGIAGLWLHHRLNDMGYHAVLLECGEIGQGQTLSSQGIIHGGSKYALNGILSKASQVISTMPSRWKNCLNGEGEIDLRHVRKLAEHQFLWSKDKLSSKMVSFFASKALRSRMQQVKGTDRPQLFQHEAFKGNVYQLDEPVLDIPSLLENISQCWSSRMMKYDINSSIEWKKQDGEIKSLKINDAYQINAQHYVLTAGEGNETLLKQLNLSQPAMQKRPLQMVLCKSKVASQPLPAIYAHSLGSGSKPIATISSHQNKEGNTVWYIGGNIAEEGVSKPQTVLIEEAKQLLSEILPWVTLPELEWATHAVNRAEPKQSALSRPDSAFLESQHNLHVCWPTKLALAPDLSDQVIEALTEAVIEKHQYDTPPLPTPCIATPLWDRAFNS